MILFKPEHVEPILNGTKTQTRRIWKRSRAKVGSIHLAKTKMLSKEYFCQIRILEVREEWLLDIHEKDAIAEGYPSKAAYIEAFYKISKVPEVHFDYRVYVVRFEVVA